MRRPSPSPGESQEVTDSCAEWNSAQSVPASAGAQAGKLRVRLWEAGWACTEEDALDLDLRGEQPFGTEGTAYAKGQKLGGTLAYWEMLAGHSQGEESGEWGVEEG